MRRHTHTHTSARTHTHTHTHNIVRTRSIEQHNQLLESSTVAALKSEVSQLEERMKREVKQQELQQNELAKLRARWSAFYNYIQLHSDDTVGS